ncbi:MAG: macro domain-containing protein [Gemmatimonadota bacterium]
MIRVVVDDLAFLPVDAVLRPANERLDPVTPAMSRLDAQAGERFAEQRKVQIPLDIGAAVVTGAGDLAAKFVVHAVIQSRESSTSRDAVRRALLSAWQRASDWELGAIATPLVGTGAGQLSVEEATSLLSETLQEHRARAQFPSEVQIVLEDERERDTVQAVVTRHGL